MLTKQNRVKHHNYITILPDIDDVNLTLGEIVLRKIINNFFLNAIEHIFKKVSFIFSRLEFQENWICCELF